MKRLGASGGSSKPFMCGIENATGPASEVSVAFSLALLLAHDHHAHHVALAAVGEGVAHVGGVDDALAVDLEEHVAHLHLGRLGRAAGLDVLDEQPRVLGRAEELAAPRTS